MRAVRAQWVLNPRYTHLGIGVHEVRPLWCRSSSAVRSLRPPPSPATPPFEVSP